MHQLTGRAAPGAGLAAGRRHHERLAAGAGVLPYIVLGLGMLLTMGHALNVLQFGDEQAQQLGLPVQRVRLLIIVAASLTTAAAVAFAGIIGFVGLIVPHLVRLVWGSDYRHLLPLSMICGAASSAGSRCAGAHGDGPAGASGGDHHRPGRGALFLVGAAPGQAAAPMVSLC